MYGQIFSNATVELLARGIHMLEKTARERFLSSGRNSDAEEWHKVRNAKDELNSWISRR